MKNLANKVLPIRHWSPTPTHSASESLGRQNGGFKLAEVKQEKAQCCIRVNGTVGGDVNKLRVSDESEDRDGDNGAAASAGNGSTRTTDEVAEDGKGGKHPALRGIEDADTENNNENDKSKELSLGGRLWRILWLTGRICFVFVLLYFFICSLDVLQDSFQLLGGRAAGNVFTNNALLNNPVCGLMIGVLVTVLVQSSSTSTSIVVSMVGSGLLQVRQAIPIVMGANIGTTVTNTLVSLTQSADRDMFRLAFAGATVHDMFNWLTVIILLPLEVATGYLYHLATAMTSDVVPSESLDNPQFLKIITTPLTKQIVQLDKHVITAIAESKDRQKFPLLKYYCKEVTEDNAVDFYSGEANETLLSDIRSRLFTTDVQIRNDSGSPKLTWTEIVDANSTKCSHVFVGCGLPGAPLTETGAGLILVVFSLAAMVLCLVFMVKTLSSLLQGPMAAIIRKSINADFPGRAAFLTPYVALVIGAIVTVLVQSSSVFTSALTPLVGLGVVTVERVYPLTLGSNIGTTITSILAALTADANMIKYTLQISFCHLFFNITGIILFFPVPILRRIPIDLAKKLGNVTSRYRWFAIIYLILLYLLLPLVVFLLSLAGWFVLLAVGGPAFLLFLFVVVVNILQNKRPHWLPAILRSWHFLPRVCRSLAPYDRIMTVCCRYKKSPCRKCLGELEPEVVVDNEGNSTTVRNGAMVPVTEGVVNASFKEEFLGPSKLCKIRLCKLETHKQQATCSRLPG